MNGFRKMISDNIPLMWDLALRWCHYRDKWIEHVYTMHIAPYNHDWRPLKERNRLKALEVKIMTHHSKNSMGHLVSFKDTIEFEKCKMTSHEKACWKTVIDWVTWFEEMFGYVESSAKIQIECNYKTIDEAAEYVNTRYCLGDINLAKYIIKNIRNVN